VKVVLLKRNTELLSECVSSRLKQHCEVLSGIMWTECGCVMTVCRGEQAGV